ncbi:VCBS repeat-containing protein [bacterium]|nr:VCBS repeat-containing protein [bacterium]
MNHFFNYRDNRFIRQIFLLGILLLILVGPSWAASASFGSPKVIVDVYLYPYVISVNFHLADINADGRKDIVAVYNNAHGHGMQIGALSWFENDGLPSPSFMEHNLETLQGNFAGCGWVNSADMDGDGKLDIIYSRYQEIIKSGSFSTIAILKNNGGQNPVFSYQSAVSWNDNTYIPGFVTDLNHDDRPDVVVYDDRWLNWYRNDGGQPIKFTMAEPLTLTLDGYFPYLSTDLDGDGDNDFVLARGDAMAMRWDENNGAASPSFTRHDINQGTSGSLTVADLNGDGRMDIVAGGRFYLNNGGRPATFRLPITFGLPGKTATGDLSGSGNTEVVSSTGHWYSNPGGSSPSLTTHTLTMPAGVKSFDDLAVGDVTGDGNPDIVASAGNRIYLYANQLPARGVRVLSPEGGERLVGGRDPLVVHWKTDVATAGTAVNLELWEGMHKVTNLKYASNPSGEQTEILTFPDITHTGWYRIRAVASPSIYAFNPNPFMLILPNNIHSDKWTDYR